MRYGILILLMLFFMANIWGCGAHEPLKPPSRAETPARAETEELRGYQPQADAKEPEKPAAQSKSPRPTGKFGGQTIRAKEAPE